MMKKVCCSLALLSALAVTPAYPVEVPNGDFEEGAYEFSVAMWSPKYKQGSIKEEMSAGNGRRCFCMEGTTGKSINVYMSRAPLTSKARKYKATFTLYVEAKPAGKNPGFVILRNYFYPAKGKGRNYNRETRAALAKLPMKKWTVISQVIELPANVDYKEAGFFLYSSAVPTGVTVYVDDITLTPVTK